MSEIPGNVAYNLTWTSEVDPQEASSFVIFPCNTATKVCTHNKTGHPGKILPFDYFANYSVTVSAVYKLRLNQTQIRTSQASTVTTPGTSEIPFISDQFTLSYLL